MSDRRWTDVDAYIADRLIGDDPVLAAALQASQAAGLPQIAVSAAQGKLLHLLARSIATNRILEVGTLGGYSGIWLGRALPSWGRLVTLEIDPKHAAVAQSNFAHAGLDKVAEIRVGPALQTLDRLEGPPFDLAFIDADKESNPAYFEHALRMSRKGSIIVIDNVVRDGRVIDPNGNAQVQGVRKLFDLIARESRVSATAIQTVGDKGYDGFLMALVL